MSVPEDQSRELVRVFGRHLEGEPASKRNLSETELRLQKEIEGTRLEIQDVRLEIKNVEINLQKEMKNVELKLSTNIKELDTKLSVQMESIRSDLIRWFVGASIALEGLLGALIKFGK